jgi:hypothetical protein
MVLFCDFGVDECLQFFALFLFEKFKFDDVKFWLVAFCEIPD